MPHSSDSSDSSFSRSPPPGKQDSSDDVRRVQRREKNRIAAQKSRQRQTQKADTLHLVSVQISLHPCERQALPSTIQEALDHSFHSACVGMCMWGGLVEGEGCGARSGREALLGVLQEGSVGRAWWFTPVIPALWEAKVEFETSLANMVKPHLYYKYKKLTGRGGVCL
ncbi:Basic leucine zipper transcriptional factor ATF-like [Plecturocebus cupreus]